MTAADYAVLIPSAIACLAALTAYLKSRTTAKQVQAHMQEHDH